MSWNRHVHGINNGVEFIPAWNYSRSSWNCRTSSYRFCVASNGEKSADPSYSESSGDGCVKHCWMYYIWHRNEFMHIYNWTQISNVAEVLDRTILFYPERLQKITNVLLRNLDVLTDFGLANGKIGDSLVSIE